MEPSLTVRDHAWLRQRGVSVTEVERQLALFRDPPPPLRLDRPCTLGDGIRRVSEPQRAVYESAYESARADGRLLKFVPASGAASRMFGSLLELLESGIPNDAAALAACAERQPAAADAKQLLDHIERFAFRDALAAALARNGVDLADSVRRGDVGTLVRTLVTQDGLDYGNQPKALLPFHRYDKEVRTALEEHLVEAAAYASSNDRTCRLHFTVSPEQRPRFETLVEAVRERYESRGAVRYEIAWSSQKPSTDTVAVGADDSLFRTAEGLPLLRPGGHGALLENLNDLRADIVLIKNIDNVTVERCLPETVVWKKVLVGLLCDVQARVFAHLRELRQSPSEPAVDAACRFACDELQIDVPLATREAGGTTLAAHLRTALDRPIRVCGMVPNTGEPGGGPAWVRAPDGSLSVQIVERAQIDGGSEEQRAIFDSFTHFSPVDFACGVRNVDGQCFDLRSFVDADAVIFAEKSSDGRPLRALEHPGLWNGGMAHWLTLFVEVPITTFNPVKTFLDLLRPAHQPGDPR